MTRGEHHIARLKEAVLQTFGLAYPSARTEELMQGLREAARELGYPFSEPESDPLQERILSGSLSNDERLAIAAHLTIGETFFFREPGVLKVLREEIFPSFLVQKQGTSHLLKCWSAGCSSGEEPYTLAMMLMEQQPDPTRWSLLGTDINPRMLEKARAGIYTRWSFRETPETAIRRWFIPTNGHFTISQAIRDQVTFRYFNLVTDQPGAVQQLTPPPDLIFCRNVLMYFSPEIARHVIEKLFNLLPPGGWLIPSQVELSDTLFNGFDRIRFGSVFLYRKPTSPSRMPVHSKKEPSSRMPVHPGKEPLSRRTETPREKDVPKPVTKPRLTGKPESTRLSDIEPIRILANQGKLDEAHDLITGWLKEHPTSPSGYYLSGLIQLEKGVPEEAMQLFGKVLYLEPHHLMAHYQLLLLNRKEGKVPAANRYARNIHRLLKSCDPETGLPDGEGITAAELEFIVTDLNQENPVIPGRHEA